MESFKLGGDSLFDKQLTVPTELLQTEALLGRLRSDHPKRQEIESFIKIKRSGYNGEKAINYYLSLYPEKRFHIFHDLRLPLNGKFFQMDVVLLTVKGIILLEGKNHSGKLTIERNQMVQEFSEKREVYENPIAQAFRHKELLRYWLEKYQIPLLPIHYLVVISKSSTEVLISTDYKEAENKICKAYDLLKKIGEVEPYFTKECLDTKTMNKVRRLFLNKHTPKQTDILEKFNVNSEDVLNGVHCPYCLAIPMTYKQGKWVCSSCDKTSKDAYFKAVNDYFLLIKPTITNSEFRHFLEVPTSRATTYLLSLLTLPTRGVNRHRIYFNKSNPDSSIYKTPI